MVDDDIEKVRQEIDKIRTHDIPAYIKQVRDRAEAALAESRRRNADLFQRIEDDLKDPLLRGPVDMVRDLEFLPDGRLNMVTVQRVISQWRDAQGHIIYTPEANLPLDQIRRIRDKVVIQQYALGSLPEEERSEIETEYKSSGGKSEVSILFQDYLRSQQLGERFAHLKQNPPRPTFGKK